MKFKRRFVKKFKYNYKTRFLLPLLVLVCVSLGLGYAYLQTDLSIVGVTKLKDNEWNVHFDNIQPVEGSVEPVTAPSISELTTVSFSAQLENPGDKYEFYIDVVNSGTIDAMVDSLILLPELTTDQAKYLSYEVTYRNGAPISQHELLTQGQTKTLKVSFKYLENADTSNYPQEDTVFNIAATVNYVQANESAVDYIGAHPCIYNGELVQGAEYTNGQYTYRYMQEYNEDETTYEFEWHNISEDGWGVKITNHDATNPITSTLCSSINDKPIVSMSGMFYNSQATTVDLSSFDTSNTKSMMGMFYNSQFTSLDLSSFDTSNVVNMIGMFNSSHATTLDLRNFNTSKVTDMNVMFWNSQATSIDLSNFDTSSVMIMRGMFAQTKVSNLILNNFNTSNVTNMSYMFFTSEVTSLDLSSFDTSNVTDMSYMFYNSQASILDLSSFDTTNVTNMNEMFTNAESTTGYGKTQADCDKFNSSSNKPAGLVFTVKS